MLPLTLLPLLLLPPTPTHTLTLPPHPLTYPLTCTPKTSFLTCPTYYDCAHAIFLLPTYDGEGAFHNGPPDDPFRLPVVKEHGSCRVVVELRHQGGSRESSGWQWIVGRLLKVNKDCISTRDLPINAGGWSSMGKHDRIVVGLAFRGRGDGNGNGNGTVL